MFDVDLYRLVHRGNAGDVAFYSALCEGAASVLELGCGDGRLAAVLAGEGADVVGIEPHPDMRALCVGFDVIDGDMRAFDLGRRFDRVVVPYTGLYCLPDDAAVVDCFRCVAAHLEADGRFAFDGYLVNPELPGGTDPEEWLTTVYEDEQRIDIFESGDHFPAQHRFDVTYAHQIADARPTYTLHHHYLVADEVAGLLAAGGLVLEAMYGDFRRTPFVEEEADRMVVVARRA